VVTTVKSGSGGGLVYSGGSSLTLTSHRTDNGDHLGLSALLSSTSGWPTRHSVWSVKCPPPTEASEHPRTRDAAAPWMVRHSPQSKSQAVKPLIYW